MTFEQEERQEKRASQSNGQNGKEVATCPLCGNEMVFIQVCHLRCNSCGSELSCEDKGWFWG